MPRNAVEWRAYTLLRFMRDYEQRVRSMPRNAVEWRAYTLLRFVRDYEHTANRGRMISTTL